MKLNIKGTIISNDDVEIYDYFNIENTAPSKISDALNAANGGDVEIEINSGGGNVIAGSEIYSMLSGYKGKKTISITGLAGSAASVIAMAHADKCQISPTALMMIHNCNCVTQGDFHDMQIASETLKTINKSISNAYAIKTGKSQEELLALMDRETWMSAQECVRDGFCDSIIDYSNENQPTNVGFFNASNTATILNQSTIDKVRNMLIEQKTETVNKVKCRIKLLEMGGMKE